MELESSLLALEELIWKGDADFFRGNLDERAPMVFAPPVAVLDKQQTVDAIASAPRSTVRLEDARVVGGAKERHPLC